MLDQDPTNCALFLDLDGTLFDIAPTPDAVRIPPDLASLLARLHAGLRGAVPIVLALFPVNEAVRGNLEFLNIVFFAVVVSTLLQGTTFEALARRLGEAIQSMRMSWANVVGWGLQAPGRAARGITSLPPCASEAVLQELQRGDRPRVDPGVGRQMQRGDVAHQDEIE